MECQVFENNIQLFHQPWQSSFKRQKTWLFHRFRQPAATAHICHSFNWLNCRGWDFDSCLTCSVMTPQNAHIFKLRRKSPGAKVVFLALLHMNLQEENIAICEPISWAYWPYSFAVCKGSRRVIYSLIVCCAIRSAEPTSANKQGLLARQPKWCAFNDMGYVTMGIVLDYSSVWLCCALRECSSVGKEMRERERQEREWMQLP